MRNVIQFSDFFNEDPLVGTRPAYTDISGIQAMAGWGEDKEMYDLTERPEDPHLEALLENLAVDILAAKNHLDSIARQYALIQQLTESP